MKHNTNIIFIIFSFIILLLNFGVFPNITGPYIFINIIYLSITSYYIILNYKKKIIYFNSKLDYLIMLLTLTSFIPLIFNKCVSLENEYNYIMQNLSILSIYVLTKNLSLNNKNKIINLLIYSTIPIVIIAFDRLNFNIIWNLISKLKFLNINYDYGGLLANFNYPNSLGIYLSSILLLLCYQIIKDKNNIFHKIYFTIIFTLIILTKAKSIIILDLIFFTLYILSLKKHDKKQIINLIIISTSYLLFEIFILHISNYNIIKIFLQVILVIVYMELYFYKCDNKNFFNNKVLLISLILFLSCVIVSISLKDYSIPIKIEKELVFEYSTDNKKKYDITIDVNAIKKNNNINNFNIKIYAIYKDGLSKEIINDEFEEFNGIKEFNINDKKDIYILRFTFENLDLYKNNIFIINNIFINNKEFIINYKYLPSGVGNFLNNFSFKDRGLMYRFEYYKNALRIIKNNWLFGNGANSWNRIYKKNQSYFYNTSESHSYFIDTFIDFGIVSFILLVLIYLLLIKKLIYMFKYQDNQLYLILSILIILIHSVIDFNMSFLLIKTYMFILISLINVGNLNKKTNNNIICLVFLIILLIFNIFNIYGLYNYKKYKNIKEVNINKLNEKQKRFINLSNFFYPVNKKIRYEYYIINYEDKELENRLLLFMDDEVYFNQLSILNRIIKINLKDNNKNNIKNIYNIIKNNNIYNVYDINDANSRAKVFIDVAKNLYEKYEDSEDDFYLEYYYKINNLIVNEYEFIIKKNDYKNKKELSDYNFLINNYVSSIK